MERANHSVISQARYVFPLVIQAFVANNIQALRLLLAVQLS